MLLRIASGALLLSSVALGQGSASSSAVAQPKRPLPEGVSPPQIEYRDIAPEAGLRGTAVSGSSTEKSYIVESTGTGLAIIDIDGDELLDVLLVSADRFEEEGPEPRHYLYKNLGGLRFADVTEVSGIEHTGWAQGACVGDIDDNGFDDIVIPHWGQNRLYRNQGDGTFREESARRGLTEEPRRWGTGCAFLDFDRDGDLDLFVANYLRFDPAKTPKPGEGAECRWKGIAVLCGPRGLPGESMSLYENDGHGMFADVSSRTGIETEKLYYGFTPLTGDFDNDGWTDVYVACDSTASLFFHNKGEGMFEEIGVISGTAYNMDGQEQAGMGATAADFDLDGDLDIFKTNFSNDTHTLYVNEGMQMFIDETVTTGLAVNTQFLGWGTAFLDIDHDGLKDLFVANGHVYPGVDEAGIGETFRQRRLVYWNYGRGRFHDMSEAAGSGVTDKHSSRGLAVADLDNDGTLEIVTVNMHEDPSLLKQFAPTGNALIVDARLNSGRAAIGARVRVKSGGRAQMDEVRSGGYHISQGDTRVHFGLGREELAAVAVRWPDGSESVLEKVKANTRITVQQGKGLIKSAPVRSAKSSPWEDAAVGHKSRALATGESLDH